MLSQLKSTRGPMSNHMRTTTPRKTITSTITRNADPSQHIIWSTVPDIEDFQPHDVQVDITPEDMRIYYDGQEIAHQRKPASFNGGYLFLSGSTGWATNRHRVSDLEILHTCQ